MYSFTLVVLLVWKFALSKEDFLSYFLTRSNLWESPRQSRGFTSINYRIDDIETKLTNVRKKVREAYEVLSVADTRWQYDRSFANASPESTLAAHTVVRHSPDSRTGSAQTLVPGSSPKKEQAELLFLDARRLYNDGDYFNAIASLNEVLNLDPGSGRYNRLLAQWLAPEPRLLGSVAGALRARHRARRPRRRSVPRSRGASRRSEPR